MGASGCDRRVALVERRACRGRTRKRRRADALDTPVFLSTPDAESTFLHMLTRSVSLPAKRQPYDQECHWRTEEQCANRPEIDCR